MTIDERNIGTTLNEIELEKLRSIIDDLFESGAVNSKEIQDFLKFTIFIVFDEADKNKESLRKFYSANLKKYNAYKTEK
jgi:hypothetical protein